MSDKVHHHMPWEANKLGEEIIKKVLMNSGLTEKEAEIYIFLSQHEVRKGAEIARLLRKDKAQVFRILRRLQNKGFVEETLEFPSRFTVVPFKDILDSLVKAKQEEVAFIKSAKKDLLKYISEKRQVGTLEKFVVIKGNKRIYSKISKIIQNAKHQLSIATTFLGLMRADRFGVFDVAFNHPLKSHIQYRFLTELSKEKLNAFETWFKRVSKPSFNFKARNPNLGLDLFPRMIIRDNDEILFYTSRNDTIEKDEICLWTNCRSIVRAFGAIFEELWQNSTDAGKKINELKTGKPTPKTCVMAETETAQTYWETLQSAEEYIILITSSKGLIEYSKQAQLIEKWNNHSVQVKIMAPIVRENTKEAQQLQEKCEVRHVPENYVIITIVDGKHLFQFKTQPIGQKTLDSQPNFQNTLYTNEFEYIEKMKNTLNDIWKNAHSPSPITLESIIGSYGSTMGPFLLKSTHGRRSGVKITDIKPIGTMTEKEVLDRIIHAKRIIAKDPAKDVSRLYASIGTVVIHPPDYFNLPKLLINVSKIEKQSSFGAEDALTIFLWLKLRNSTRHAFVPVASAGDNPRAQQRRKALFSGTPAAQNVQVVGKNKLQVRVHGNTMFAGWTTPITLYPPPYVLPPACLLIEGHGNVKTVGFTMLHPSGFKSRIEENYFDAFVTFMHQSSKYSGPGTDGVFARDHIMTNYPPKSNSGEQ